MAERFPGERQVPLVGLPPSEEVPRVVWGPSKEPPVVRRAVSVPEAPPEAQQQGEQPFRAAGELPAADQRAERELPSETAGDRRGQEAFRRLEAEPSVGLRSEGESPRGARVLPEDHPQAEECQAFRGGPPGAGRPGAPEARR